MRRLFFIMTALAASTCQAALVERDWLAPGDGLLTYDPNTGLEWLDITESELIQFGATVDGAVEEVMRQMSLGSLFPDFVLATRSEVFQLLESAGYDGSSIAARTATAQLMRKAISLLGAVSASSAKNPIPSDEAGGARAMIGETLSPVTDDRTAYLALTPKVTEAFLDIAPYGVASISVSNGSDIFGPTSVRYTGLWLYRHAVPEPESATLLMLVLVTCGLFSPRHAQQYVNRILLLP